MIKQLLNRWEPLPRASDDIETEAAPQDLAALLTVVRRTWSRYGETDPYYSVWTDPKFRGAPSADLLQLFYTSGEFEAIFAKKVVNQYHPNPQKIRTVLEFGCGLGRVSCWLARNFPEVIGVDISRKHLDLASSYMAEQGITNFRPWHLSDIDDLPKLPNFDLLYTAIVLQHNPPPVIRIILTALLGKMNRRGFGIFQVPISHPEYSFSVRRHLENEATDIEMHAFPMLEVQRLVRQQGCKILEANGSYSICPGWHSYTFVVQKR